VKKIKVMVIDDSTTICRSAELFLSNAGYEVVKVGDGFEALSKIIEEEPDLVFIDVLMPKLDGLQTCQIIKKNSDFQDMPIIFLSSKDGEFDKARGFMVGAADYLTKPFTKDKIINMVKKYTKEIE
jgi:twitching motility two-component system response regulator PilG